MRICFCYPAEMAGRVDITEKISLKNAIKLVTERHKQEMENYPAKFAARPELFRLTIKDMLEDFIVVNWAWVEDDDGTYQFRSAAGLFDSLNFVPRN